MLERLSQLAELARNPAANPTATAIGIAIIAVFLLLIVVSLLAWVLPGSRRAGQPAPREPAAPVAPPSRARILVGRIVIGALVFTAIAAFYGMTSQSSFCGTTCHGMLPRGDTWAKSSHASVPCVRCHEGVPVLSAPSALLTRGHSLYAQLTGTAAGGSSVPSSRCLGCHSGILTSVVVSKSGLAMAHEQVIAKGSTCDDCHGSQGHEKKGVGPTMASCLRCHDGKTASAACTTCHRKPAQSITGVGDTGYGKVRLPNKPTCEGCHSQDTCDTCHGIRMPHPDNFADPKLHARLAAFGGKNKVCYRCHTFSDCDPCHLPFNAHVLDWQHVHAKSPRDGLWCRGCHKTKDMCALCH